MTPFEALHRLHPNAKPVTLVLCETCTEALLAELRRLFPPMQEGETCTLEGSYVMGCAFIDGTEAQCALHEFLQEDVVCPLK